MKTGFLFRTSLLLALCSLSGLCLAGIQVGGTRVVFPATDHEASIQVRNEGTEDIMIQSWIEAAPGQSESDLPFAITPSLARLGHKKQQMLRIFYQGKGLPEDRESVVWLSVQEIPQVSKTENSLQVAFRQRLKIFYRPKGLPGAADEAANKLSWKVLETADGRVLQATNDSAFHVSFGQVKVIAGQKEYPVEAAMISPRSSEKIKIKDLPKTLRDTAEVHWESINDYGALIKHKAAIQL
ncbi:MULTISPECIES: molecular chaperone [unclassified Pseudomonas]|jgi:P pilus assembly chaperone PapD|uniref:fimbrial biogenesis chaperone n=1 Tax=unclassified Pseudomonas TaxID=196821 RepID=UPI000730C8E3|nr:MULTISPECIES: molecular chaperone [unclassified Pseudomonas]KSW23122.1 molecular chaperone [Pseudomonas sp. ADP]OBP08703.1 molecular chaperone [Pseudomonas sp. EGD-AKN5]QOF86066.1 molecular chaperone [Pseudomonas sp. ADPe]